MLGIFIALSISTRPEQRFESRKQYGEMEEII